MNLPRKLWFSNEHLIKATSAVAHVAELIRSDCGKGNSFYYSLETNNICAKDPEGI